MNEFDFEGTIWHYRNPNMVFFVSLPEEVSADVLALVGTSLNPWGTVPVDATIDPHDSPPEGLSRLERWRR